jgi:hypothetical protein
VLRPVAVRDDRAVAHQAMDRGAHSTRRDRGVFGFQ